MYPYCSQFISYLYLPVLAVDGISMDLDISQKDSRTMRHLNFSLSRTLTKNQVKVVDLRTHRPTGRRLF